MKSKPKPKSKPSLHSIVRSQGFREGIARSVKTQSHFRPIYQRDYLAGLKAALKTNRNASTNTN